MRFDITPLDGMADTPMVIRVVDAVPRSRVTIRTETEDALGRHWSASGLFLGREDGTIDLTEDAPVQGSYSTKDPVGLVSSLAPVGKDPATLFATLDAAPIEITFTAGERDQVETSVVVVRRMQGPGVQAFRLEEGDVAGHLYVPADPAPTGAVLVVPGLIAPRVAALPLAAMLASLGYLALSLDAPTNAEGQCAEVPLERVRDAAALLRSHPRCSGRIAGLGLEKGAEALLATACHLTDTDFSAVIAIAPSCVVWQASGPGKVPATSSWTVDGQPLPYVPVRGPGAKLLRLGKKDGGAVAQLGAHMDGLKDVAAFKRAALPVERIAGPILLLAGAEDQQWPAAEMAELIYRARRAERSNEGDQKIAHQKAGRLGRFPHLPATVSRYLDPATGTALVLGGTPEGNHHADEVTWTKIREFLALHLGAPAAGTDTGLPPDETETQAANEAATQAETDGPHEVEDHEAPDDPDDLPPVVYEVPPHDSTEDQPPSFS